MKYYNTEADRRKAEKKGPDQYRVEKITVTAELYRLFRILIFFYTSLFFPALFFSASPFSGPRRHALLVPVSITIEQAEALLLARDCGLGRVCLTLWFFNNHICHRMLAREPVHGMCKKKSKNEERIKVIESAH